MMYVSTPSVAGHPAIPMAHRRLIETTTDQNLFRSGELRHVVRTIGS